MRYEVSGKNIEAYIDFTKVRFLLKNVVQYKNIKVNNTETTVTIYDMKKILKTLHKGKLNTKSKNVFEVDKRGNNFIFVASIPYGSKVQVRSAKITNIKPKKGKLPLSVIIKRSIPGYNIEDEVAIIEAKKEQLPVTVQFDVEEKIWDKEPQKKLLTIQLNGYAKNEDLQITYSEESVEDKEVDSER